MSEVPLQGMVSGFGFKVWALGQGCAAQGSGPGFMDLPACRELSLRVWGLGSGVLGFGGTGVWGLGFRV